MLEIWLENRLETDGVRNGKAVPVIVSVQYSPVDNRMFCGIFSYVSKNESDDDFCWKLEMHCFFEKQNGAKYRKKKKTLYFLT